MGISHQDFYGDQQVCIIAFVVEVNRVSSSVFLHFAFLGWEGKVMGSRAFPFQGDWQVGMKGRAKPFA